MLKFILVSKRAVFERLNQLSDANAQPFFATNGNQNSENYSLMSWKKIFSAQKKMASDAKNDDSDANKETASITLASFRTQKVNLELVELERA